MNELQFVNNLQFVSVVSLKILSFSLVLHVHFRLFEVFVCRVICFWEGFFQLQGGNKQALPSDLTVGLTIRPTDSLKVCACSSFEQLSECDWRRQEELC